MRKYKLFGLRLPDEMRNFVREEAKNNLRSQNKQIELWIKEKMDEKAKPAK